MSRGIVTDPHCCACRYKDSMKYVPQTAMGLWQCGCGSWQKEGTACIQCGAAQAFLLNASELSTLEKRLSTVLLKDLEWAEKVEDVQFFREKGMIITDKDILGPFLKACDDKTESIQKGI